MKPKAISPWLLRWFSWYARGYLKRNFNAVRLLKKPILPSDRPLVFYLNHASWWDPLVALFLSRKFIPEYQSYGPIDAAALTRYRFLERLGFFPVERDSVKGARQFLAQSRAILSEPNCALWLTPQGHFRDARDRPVVFEKGLGHVGAFDCAPLMIPVAIEYVWWFEKLPEVLIAIGEPAQNSEDSSENTRRCEAALGGLQDELAAASKARNAEAFSILLDGSKSISVFYDGWRKFKARVRGKRFSAGHQSH